MLKSYLKTAWRNITRNKLFSILNIAGLATGMAVALLIGLWVFYQYSYDRFFPEYDRAYQVKNNYTTSSGKVYTQDVLPIPLAEALKKDVPGIENVAVTFSVTYGPMSESLSVGRKSCRPRTLQLEMIF